MSRALNVTLVSKLARRTGLSRYADELATQLRAIGVDVGLQAPRRFKATSIRGRFDPSAFLNDYPVAVNLPTNTDLVHLTTQTEASLLALGRIKAPAVVTVHDIIPYVLRNHPTLSNYRHIADRAFDRLALSGLRRARAIVAVSQSTKRDLERHLGLDPQRVHVVPQGVDHCIFRPQSVPDDLWSRYGLHPERPLLLYVGSEAPHKNLAGLIEAFAVLHARYPEALLVEVGSGNGRLSEIDALLAKLGLASSVIRFKDVSDDDLSLFYAASRLFTTASVYEGFCLPVLEAMACGTPVVCFDAAALPEVIGDAGVQVPVGNTELLGLALLRVYEDAELRARLSAAAQRRASCFSWAGTASKTATVYNLTLGREVFIQENAVPGQIRHVG